jgi:hypothetical protein
LRANKFKKRTVTAMKRRDDVKSVRVAVRIRPLLPAEQSEMNAVCVRVDTSTDKPNTIHMREPRISEDAEHKFT